MKDLTEEVSREKAGKEVAVETAKEKTNIVESAEKRASATEKSRASVEKKSAELVVWQNETEMKLAKTGSLNSTLSEEVVDLWAALEACESKWYDEGFANADKSVEPAIMQARQVSFREGWMAAL